MSTANATLAGGCFWGMEALFRQLPGVLDTEVGYTGGRRPDPVYEQVKTGVTGHAEAIRITFDPNALSYEQLLAYFFSIHDPTTANRQGHDVGSQYRSAIFYHDEDQRILAQRAIITAAESGRWSAPIVTQLEPTGPFYPAEDCHQDYLQKNPGGYTCHWVRP